MQEQTWSPVEQHRAGAAVAGVAADLGPDQAEVVAQHVGQAPRRIGDELARARIDVAAHDLDRRASRAVMSARARARARRSSVRVASSR